MKKLWGKIMEESEKLASSIPQIPIYYTSLLGALQNEKKYEFLFRLFLLPLPPPLSCLVIFYFFCLNRGIIKQENFHEYGFGQEWKENVEKGLSYLHSAGDVVWINVCDPFFFPPFSHLFCRSLFFIFSPSPFFAFAPSAIFLHFVFSVFFHLSFRKLFVFYSIIVLGNA